MATPLRFCLNLCCFCRKQPASPFSQLGAEFRNASPSALILTRGCFSVKWGLNKVLARRADTARCVGRFALGGKPSPLCRSDAQTRRFILENASGRQGCARHVTFSCASGRSTGVTNRVPLVSPVVVTLGARLPTAPHSSVGSFPPPTARPCGCLWAVSRGQRVLRVPLRWGTSSVAR